MCYSQSDLTWNNRNMSFHKSFNSFLELFTDKIVATINDTVLVTYSDHVILFKISHSYSYWILKNGLKLVVLITVDFMDSMEDLNIVEELLSIENENLVTLQDQVRLTSSSSGREKEMRIVKQLILEIIRPFGNITVRGFLVLNIGG